MKPLCLYPPSPLGDRVRHQRNYGKVSKGFVNLRITPFSRRSPKVVCYPSGSRILDRLIRKFNLALHISPLSQLLNVVNCDASGRPLAASSSAPFVSKDEPAEKNDIKDIRLLSDLWPMLARRYGETPAVQDPHGNPTTTTEYSFENLSQNIRAFAAGLHRLGVQKGDRVSLFAENSARWLIADQGVIACGAADAVRGVSSSREELEYIANHSKSTALILQDEEILRKIAPSLRSSSVPAIAKGKKRTDNIKGVLMEEGEGSHTKLQTTIRFIVVLNPSASVDKSVGDLSCPVYGFDDVLNEGLRTLKEDPVSLLSVQQDMCPDDLATLVYTSGTTGRPKGVRLSHANLLYQVMKFPSFLEIAPGQRTLSILPPWHVYERVCAYYILSCGACQVITNIKHLKQDLSLYRPNHFVCVPLVLETLRSRVLATLRMSSPVRRILALNLLAISIIFLRHKRVLQGIDLRFAKKPPSIWQLFRSWVMSCFLAPLKLLFNVLVASKIRNAIGVQDVIVCGGGSLGVHLDDFYEAIGMVVLNGYGLTETSPVLTCRSTSAAPYGNVRGSVGRNIPGTELRFVDPSTYQDVCDGEQGLILARGPGVMSGYEGDESATAAAFSAGGGWLSTGDLGWRAPGRVPRSHMGGCVVLTGRSKDTIILSNGENVEPQPLEDALCASPYIKYAIVIGQGHRRLGALIVPDEDSFASLASNGNGSVLSTEERTEILRDTLRKITQDSPVCERIHQFVELQRPFSVEDGTLTRTLKPRRTAIMETYAKEVASLESKLR